jgi:hypothetical protein
VDVARVTRLANVFVAWAATKVRGNTPSSTVIVVRSAGAAFLARPSRGSSLVLSA